MKINLLSFQYLTLLLSFIFTTSVFAQEAVPQQTQAQKVLQAETLLKNYFSSKLFEQTMMGDFQTRSFEFKLKNRSYLYSLMDEVIGMYSEDQFNFDTLTTYVKHHISANALSLDFNGKPTNEIEGTMHLGMQNKQLNGPCVNMDFEQGNLNGWDMFEGDVNNSPYVMINAVQIGTPGAHHTIMTGGNDPIVGAAMPMVNPNGGGGASLRLGDGTGTGSKAASVRQTFLVDANNAAFVYSYAVVLENPGHTTGEQPFF